MEQLWACAFLYRRFDSTASRIFANLLLAWPTVKLHVRQVRRETANFDGNNFFGPAFDNWEEFDTEGRVGLHTRNFWHYMTFNIKFFIRWPQFDWNWVPTTRICLTSHSMLQVLECTFVIVCVCVPKDQTSLELVVFSCIFKYVYILRWWLLLEIT